ncbi:MAG: replication-associated recombination protein A [Candidatus Ancillula trichonymphae]|jgi:putative ATPase|nr:replication-associated recombination protein A [Candidatus Ancillula trichonymphae]
MDLFESNFRKTDQELKHLPLALRMRPQTLDEVVGQQHLLAPGGILHIMATEDRADSTRATALAPSIILHGPPGVGKTTLAYLIAKNSRRRFREVSAVSAGIREVREEIAGAKKALVEEGMETILFIDEIHRFSKTQQDALLPSVENRTVVLIGATTENPYFSVISPLLSRSIMLTLQKLENDDLLELVSRAVKDRRGLKSGVVISDAVKKQIVQMSGSDARHALTLLEVAAASAFAISPAKKPTITAKILEESVSALLSYDKDGDNHYDTASAFIKSMRGSDVDAALHYLARMIVAGEDPRFIARRIMIAASEEIAMADPSALWTAVAAASAVERIGMPEARLILAEAVVHVSLSPKSNAVTLAIDEAIADVKAGPAGPIPEALRDVHYSGAQKLGAGVNYMYAHDEPHHIARQQYLPDELQTAENGEPRRYYNPTNNGREDAYTSQLKKIRELLKTTHN